MRSRPSLLRGNSLSARTLRGSALTVLGFGGQQALRLAGNLMLTRLLFPEAFGLMALVTVFLIGLAMFSDVGLGPSVMQSPRGDDPEFLDTAWTIQVIRGVLLWLVACALAWPAALLYNEPLLAQMLPVGALTLVLTGFMPTRVLTANRHLLLGRVTAVELTTQVLGMLASIWMAWHMRSVWALILGGVLGAALHLVLMHLLLGGHRNRFRWDSAAGSELIRFGKWIFLSTLCGFVQSQGDRAILGKYLTLDQLGIYNIGYVLASFPMALGLALVARMLIPIYRESPPAASAENFARLRRMRFLLSTVMLVLVLVLAFFGVPLVGLMYSPLYALAGPIVVMLACANVLQVVGMSYDQSALAAGNSRGFFMLTLLRAAAFLVCFLIGLQLAGLPGAILGQAAAWALVHPFTALLARRHGAWDPLHDVLIGGSGLALSALALWLNYEALQPLLALSGGH